jgi:hypothetical protein
MPRPKLGHLQYAPALPFYALQAGQPSGRVACGHLLPPWTPQVVRLWLIFTLYTFARAFALRTSPWVVQTCSRFSASLGAPDPRPEYPALLWSFVNLKHDATSRQHQRLQSWPQGEPYSQPQGTTHFHPWGGNNFQYRSHFSTSLSQSNCGSSQLFTPKLTHPPSD